MAPGSWPEARQGEMFVIAREIKALDDPFYQALNELLADKGLDEFAEGLCREFHADSRDRPSIPPGVYFRMVMVGYLEGIGSERRFAWRCRNSSSLHEFLGYGLTKNPSEHSSLSKTRERLIAEAHAAVIQPGAGELLEADAALRTVVRSADGEGYDEWPEHWLGPRRSRRQRGKTWRMRTPP